MKAKLRGTTGTYFDVIEVNAIHVKDPLPFTRYYADEEGTIHEDHTLEFLPEESKEVTIEGWVARDKCGPTDLALRVYSVKPTRVTNRRRWNGHGEMSYLIDHRLFPEVTWDTEPKRVKITIAPIEE